jgi:hypothetical protein
MLSHTHAHTTCCRPRPANPPHPHHGATRANARHQGAPARLLLRGAVALLCPQRLLLLALALLDKRGCRGKHVSDPTLPRHHDTHVDALNAVLWHQVCVRAWWCVCVCVVLSVCVSSECVFGVCSRASRCMPCVADWRVSAYTTHLRDRRTHTHARTCTHTHTHLHDVLQGRQLVLLHPVDARDGARVDGRLDLVLGVEPLRIHTAAAMLGLHPASRDVVLCVMCEALCDVMCEV